jgi:DNA-directed RNA polymerase subunit M/transcription elongation factor TFIIS
MTKTQKKTYLEARGAACPYCGSHDMSFNLPVVDDGTTIIQVVGCERCQATWREIYTMTDIDD